MHRKRPRIVFWTILTFTGLCTAGLAQDTEQDLKQEIETLKQGQQMIRRELQEIKALIRAMQPQRPTTPDVRDVEFNLGDNPVLGEQTASLTLVEFTDYQ